MTKMYQDSAVSPSENPLPVANRLGLVAAQLMEAAGRVLEGDRDSAQARVARAMALLGTEPALAISPAEAAAIAGQPATRGGLAPWQILRVTGYIEEHLSVTIRLEELARLARL